MSEQPTPSSGASPSRGGWARRLRPRWQDALVATIVVAVAGGVLAWIIVVDRNRSSQTVTGPVAVPVKPVALSASALGTLTGLVGEPIYWAGPRSGYLYELTRAANRSVYVRYLPPGVEVGAKAGKYLIVATYPFPGALAALEKVANGRGVRLPGGGLAVVDEKYPKSVHLAFPNVDYQVEVFDPSPARAREVATSGQVRLAGG